MTRLDIIDLVGLRPEDIAEAADAILGREGLRQGLEVAGTQLRVLAFVLQEEERGLDHQT